MGVEPTVLFLGNCQMSKYRHLYRFHSGRSPSSSVFMSITPYFGKYDEESARRSIAESDIVVAQCVTSDVAFSKDNILKLRDGRQTIFSPYFYLPGFRRAEKIASKGGTRIDGREYIERSIESLGESAGIRAYLAGVVNAENAERVKISLTAMREREKLGCDVFLAGYVDETYRDLLPCYSINHPAPHILSHAYNQIAKELGIGAVDIGKCDPFEFAHLVLPRGTGGLSPHCVSSLDLSYAADTHWLGELNKICAFVASEMRRKKAWKK